VGALRTRVASSLVPISLALLVALPVAVYFIAEAAFVASECSGSDSAGECDTASAVAFFYAGGTLLLGAVGLAVLTLWSTATHRGDRPQ
jgi:hypothetical protein